MLPKIVDDFLSLFYPASCFACQAPLVSGEEMLCVSCIAHLPYTDYHHFTENKVADSFAGRVPLVQATSFLHFYKGGKTQAILHQLKYRNQPELGVFLGKMAARKYETTGFFKRIDGIIPIPLHPKKRAKRGYNQAEQLAKGIAVSTQKPLWPQNLVRTTNTTTQTRKSRFARWLNVETVFEVRDMTELKGKHLLIVDDVLTTGATIEAAATKLLAVNGVSLSVFTLAHA